MTLQLAHVANTQLQPSAFAFFTQKRETKALRVSAPLENRPNPRPARDA
jgi:hypothetical protein